MSKKDNDIGPSSNGEEGNVISLKGMYKDYFLDYASYVILERAVPAIEDGLKPVQRRILHAMKQMDDGRFHKVANVIGQTMQYHPHGDAAIGDALVNLGQRDLLIDCQGNWGDVRTGDPAAASRYIEARLTKFALDVAFNPQTTEWQVTYDGRKREPVTLPMKFPLLLALGAEGIAVGLSTRILPHNFCELIESSIKILQGKRIKIYPDFQTGGLVDVSDYQQGKRGGRVKVRARIEQVDKTTLAVRDLPYGTTTSSLIDSILKANDKGKIKIKQVTDNTAELVEVLIELAPGTSPDLTIDALYAFTNCEVSISPNACVIKEGKPHFLGVEEILHIATENTRDLLGQELEIRKGELQEKLHFASLERIFIEQRIYRDIETCETWEAVLETIEAGLRKYVRAPGEKSGKKDDRLQLLRDITEEDIIRLTEIRIKRISKYNTFRAEEAIAKLEEELKEVLYDLENLTAYAIAYYQRLLDTYGKGRERKTEIASFENIQAAVVAANNVKLYVDRKEGFIGHGLKKDEFVCDCSDLDEVIAFGKDGKFQVSRIDDKVFVGKGIEHVDVWKRGDDRTTYNMVYVDGKTGRAYVKRFHVSAIVRDRTYDLTSGAPNSKLLYFSANPNGEAEVITVQLSANCRARNKTFDYDFGELDIKSRSAKGNTLTKYPVRKVTLKEVGKSTLGALEVWMDEGSGRLNTDERGLFLGAYDTGDLLLAIYKEGAYEVMELDLNRRFDPKEVVAIGKLSDNLVVSAVYYEGERKQTLVKRFQIETSTLDQRFPFLSEHRSTQLLFASINEDPKVTYKMRAKGKTVEGEIDLAEFIDVKGWKSLGNKLSDYKLSSVKEVEPKNGAQEAPAGKEAKAGKKEPKSSSPSPQPPAGQAEAKKPASGKKPAAKPGSQQDKLQAGDTIDFEIKGQGKLFDDD